MEDISCSGRIDGFYLAGWHMPQAAVFFSVKEPVFSQCDNSVSAVDLFYLSKYFLTYIPFFQVDSFSCILSCKIF